MVGNVPYGFHHMLRSVAAMRLGDSYNSRIAAIYNSLWREPYGKNIRKKYTEKIFTQRRVHKLRPSFQYSRLIPSSNSPWLISFPFASARREAYRTTFIIDPPVSSYFSAISERLISFSILESPLILAAVELRDSSL